MLEIPESMTIVKQLNEAIAGKTIANVMATHSPHGFAFYMGDPNAYPTLLSGKKIDKAIAVAGQVLVFIEDMHLLFHDGVNIRYLQPGEASPKKHQLYIAFVDGSAIVCTVQMYGALYAYPAGTNENYYYTVALEKPSPLKDAFDEAYFARLCSEADAKLSVKALLATEQRIPGLGNGCLQDILFYAGINPQTKIRMLGEEELCALFQSIKRTLKEMADKGGRDTEKDIYGNAGGYCTALSSKTLPYPCRKCGGGLTRKAYLGGNVYFCENCQPIT